MSIDVEDVINKIKSSIETALKWVRTNADNGFAKMHQIFTIHGPYWHRRHKYENVQPSSMPVKSETETPQKVDASTQTEPLTVPSNTPENPKEPNAPEPEAQNVPTNLSNIDTQHLEANGQNINHEIQHDLPAENAQLKSNPLTETDNVQVNEDTQKDAAVEVEPETSYEMTEYPGDGKVPNEPVIPVDKEEQGSDAQIIDNQQLTDQEEESVQQQEPEILKPEKIERIEYHEHIRKSAPSTIIYEQQNIIILFLLFLMLIMGVYFFLLSKTQHHCPAVVIGDLNGSLKPIIKK